MLCPSATIRQTYESNKISGDGCVLQVSSGAREKAILTKIHAMAAKA